MLNVTMIVRLETDALDTLRMILSLMPDGTTAGITTRDLEAGNFDTVRFLHANGFVVEVVYTGPCDPC